MSFLFGLGVCKALSAQLGARQQAPLAGQLLLWTQVTGTTRPASLHTELQLWTEGSGWRKLWPKPAAAARCTLEAVWRRCPTGVRHLGEDARFLSEVYAALVLNSNHTGRDVENWTSSDGGLGLRKRDFPLKGTKTGSGHTKRYNPHGR